MRSHDLDTDAHDFTQPLAANPSLDPKRRYLCRHVFTDGHRCGSPALRGQDLCFYHVRSRREAPCASRAGTFVMSRIDDRTSVQLALYDVLSRVAAGDIEYKRGSVLLYGLQIASSNLARQQHTLANQPPQVEQVTHDLQLGDLGPIEEIPDLSNPAVTASAPTLPQEPALPQDPFTGSATPQLLAAEPQPAKNVLQRPTLPTPPQSSDMETPTSPPLPTHDATGHPYPAPNKLDPPSNGLVRTRHDLQPRTPDRPINLQPGTSAPTNLALPPRYTC